MQFPRFNLRNVLYCATLLAVVGLGGCGNSCFAGFSNNGNGGVSITAGNSPSACSSVPLVFKGTMRALVLKSPVCETCTAAARLEHVFVTVKSIQLRPSTVVDSDSLDWLEIAPALTTKPRQIDLMGNAGPEILVHSAILHAGSYRGLRLQFFFRVFCECGGSPLGEWLRRNRMELLSRGRWARRATALDWRYTGASHYFAK
jgi:Domain of unknown function (DUF4382)